LGISLFINISGGMLAPSSHITRRFISKYLPERPA